LMLPMPAVPVAGSPATSALTAGSYPVLATFAGTASLSGNSASLTEVVNVIPTTATLTVAPNPAYLGQVVTLVATVVGPPVATGSVSFLDNGLLLGAGALNPAGQATFTTSTLALGTHPLTAAYAPGTVFGGSVSPVVPEVILASSFAIALSPTSVTMAGGQSKTVAIQLTSVGNFAGPLALTYGPLPTYATASIAPTPVMLTAGGTGSSTLTLHTLQVVRNEAPGLRGSHPSRTERAMDGVPRRRWPAVGLASVLLILALGKRRRMARVLGVLLVGVAVQALSGCDTAWYRDEVVSPGSYVVTVTATDVNGNSQSATVTVVITP
jgi:hypothetical protein